jgi:hypothetical protein
MGILGSILGAVAGPLVGKFLSDDDDRTTTTKVEMPAWQQSAMQSAINGMQNAPKFYMNPDQQTAEMNPWLIESLGQAANWSQGQGADQVAMMNLMGMNQAGMGDLLTALAGDQANLGNLQIGMGANYAQGAGDWLMNQLQSGGKGGNGVAQAESLGPRDNFKFEYDQGTFDQIMENLGGITQGSFDSFSDKTKTSNLFGQGAGLQMGQSLLGGANTKAGQQSALLDAMTNQQIMDFGAQMAQWAGGQANAGAITSGQSTLNSQTQISNARTSAEAAMANARTAANASMYNARLGSAANMFGAGADMMADGANSFAGAASSLGYANGAYGDAGNTFGAANTQGINNINTSLGAGNYVQQYDQNALDRYNDALMYNGNIDFSRNKDMLAVLNGVPTGSSTTTPFNTNQWMSTGMMMGNQIASIFNQPTSTDSGASNNGGWGTQAPVWT